MHRSRVLAGICHPRRSTRSRSFVLLAVVAVAAATGIAAPPDIQVPQLTPFIADEDQPLTVPFSVDPGDVAPAELTVSAVMLGTGLARVSEVSLDGTNGTVRLVPWPDAFGFGTLSIVARGPERPGEQPLVANRRVPVRWVAVNDPPTLAPIPVQRLESGLPALAVPLLAGDVETPGTLTFGVSTPRPELFSELSVTGVQGFPYLRLASASSEGGTTRVAVTVTDPQGGTAEAGFVVQVPPSDWLRIPTRLDGPTNSAGQFVDFDADGMQDLVCWPGGPRFRRNLGSGDLVGRGLSAHAVQLSVPRVPPLQWADMDGNGLPDFLATSVYRQLPSDEGLDFAAVTNTAAALGRSGVAWVDLDGDGDLDTLGRVGRVPDQFDLRAYQSGSLVPAHADLPVSAALPIVGDFDGDGLPDVLLSETEVPAEQRGFHALWHNRGNFGFSRTFFGMWLDRPANAGTVDFDGDGRLDVWVVEAPRDTQDSGELLLWRNSAEGFELVARYDSGVPGVSAVPVWGDLDGDGDVDFVYPQLSSGLHFTGPSQVGRVAHDALFENDGVGGFRPERLLGRHFPDGQPAIGDVDGDGSADIWLPGDQEQILRQARPINAPPGAPTGLQALVAGDHILFLWDEAQDPNQTAALSYNLRVGTAPGTNDVVASSSLADGTRLIVGPGNNGYRTRCRLALLPREFGQRQPATFHWSVQAVDNSWAGGPWAPEQTVSVRLPANDPPRVDAVPAELVIREDGAPLRFTVEDALTPISGLSYVLDSDPPGRLVTDGQRRPFLPSQVLDNAVSLYVRPKEFPASRTESDLVLVVFDYAGLATTNRVRLVVDPLPPRGTLLTARTATGVRLSMRGFAGNPIRLESSRDLRSWQPVSETVFQSDAEQSLHEFAEDPAAREPTFFRAVWP